MQLKISKSVNIIPKAADSITEFSIFKPVISAVQCKEFKEVDLNKYEKSNSNLISLNGQWRRKADFGNLYNHPHEPEFNDFDWPQIMVPDNFGLEGELQRHYYPVWYRREFKLEDRQKFFDLVFESVDYLADVWINGRYLGHHEGYFAPFSFNITKWIKEINILSVKVQDPCENLKPWTIFTKHYKKYIKGTMNYHDSRPGGLPGRRLSPKWTNEWGQSLTTGGITQSVYLKTTDLIRIDAVFITPLNLSGNIHIAVILTNRSKENLLSKLNFFINNNDKDSQNFEFALEVVLKQGPNRIDFETNIHDPKIWDLKNPNLYTMIVEAICNNTLSDVNITTFGIRTIKLDLNPWQFYLNEKPIFIGAVNYIPCQHFSKVNESFYDKDAKIIKEAYINSVGIHAHIQCSDCYNSFDKNGILIFQDFPLQWSYDSSVNTNPGFREKACDQITEMGYLLYNHPSVVYYCCHNEPAYVFDKPKPDPIDDRDNSILDDLLQKRLQEISPMRYVHKASGVGGDLHVYDGSIGGGSIYNVRKHPLGFVSEFGFWSISEGAFKWGDVGWPPSENELVQWASRFGFIAATKTFIGHPKIYSDREAWIIASQLYGAFLAKYQTEFFRSNQYNAIRWHFFSDWWGYAGGGLVDVCRMAKLPYYWYKKALRPILLLIDLYNTVIPPKTDLKLQLMSINSFEVDKEIEWELKMYQVNGSIIIAGDPAAAGTDGTAGIPCKLYHKIAFPIDGLIKDKTFNSENIQELISYNGNTILKSNKVNELQTFSFQVPDTNKHHSYTINIRWKQNGETWEENWAHFIIGAKKWNLKPGIHYIIE
ncbi:MAG: glycoside hydrolase family 2 protein [Candidatus Helarchaeota archaeon]